MMTLAQASSYFDRTQFSDAYTGAPLFLGQMDPYDDSKRDAMAAYRRILSVAPGVSLPGHHCVSGLGINWIVSSVPEVDGLQEAHRQKYVTQQSAGLFKVSSITGFLAGDVVPQVHAFPSWLKDTKEIAESSSLAPIYEVVLPAGTVVGPRSVVWRGGEAYLVLTTRVYASGFLGASAVKLEQVEPVDLMIQQRTFAPALGGYMNGSTTYTLGLAARWQNLFEYPSEMAPRFKEGDFVVAMPEETEVDTSSRLELDGKPLSVLAVFSFPGTVVAHVRGG